MSTIPSNISSDLSSQASETSNDEFLSQHRHGGINLNNTFTPIRNDEHDEHDEEEEDEEVQDSIIETFQHQKPSLDETASTRNTDDSDGEELLDVNNLPHTVAILKTEDRKTIYLVGTSHFSKQSHRDVRRVIRTFRPRVVVLELCRNRMCFLSMDEKEIMKEAQSLDFRKILNYMKKNGFVQGFIYTLLLSASAKVTNDLKLAPGGEFRNAFNEAMKIGCTVILGDRPVDITLRRAIATLSTWQKIKITFHCLFNNEKYDEEELEKYKQKDVLERLVDELSTEFPGLSKVMVDERDSFLAHSLWSAASTAEPGSNIVGVVGIGHSAGIQNKWNNIQDIDVSELLTIPVHKPSKTLLIIKYSLYGAMAYGIYRFVIPNTIINFAHNLGKQVSSKIFTS